MSRDEHAQTLSVPVLAYHQVEPLHRRRPARAGLVIDTISFQRQLLLLRALGYRAIDLDQLAAALAGERRLPRRAVVLTFDDGYHGVCDWALPLLRRYRYTATCFLIAEDFDATRSAVAERAFPTLTHAQVQTMLASGMGIGAHSYSHPRLTDLPPEQASDEIARSKAVLEQAFGQSISAFCYPYGAHNAEIAQSVAQAGYRCALGTTFGRQHRPSDTYALRRIPVGAEQSLAAFAYRLRWASDQ